jgi:hypothetical protein
VAAVLGLGVDEHLIKIGIAIQHRRVVAIDQSAKPAPGKSLAQSSDQRRGTHQVAYVVAADNQYFGGSVKAQGKLSDYGYFCNR